MIGMPYCRSAAAGPIPDNISRCGDWIPPAETNNAPPLAHAAFYSSGASPLEQHALGQRVCDDPQVLSSSHGPQIGVGGGDAPAVLHRQLVIACSFLRLAVEIVRARNAVCLRRGDEGLDQLMSSFDAAHRYRSTAAVQLAFGMVGVTFQFDEIRQHVVPGPADVPKPSPMVVIVAVAANSDQTIDRARSAEHASPR